MIAPTKNIFQVGAGIARLLSFKAHGGKHSFLREIHVKLVLFARFVIVAEKVERGVNGEETYLAEDAVSVFVCLLHRSFCGNNYVSEGYGFCGEINFAVKAVLPHREGEHVRGSVLAAVFAVELMDMLVVHKGYGKLRIVRKVFVQERELYRFFDEVLRFKDYFVSLFVPRIY